MPKGDYVRLSEEQITERDALLKRFNRMPNNPKRRSAAYDRMAAEMGLPAATRLTKGAHKTLQPKSAAAKPPVAAPKKPVRKPGRKAHKVMAGQAPAPKPAKKNMDPAVPRFCPEPGSELFGVIADLDVLARVRTSIHGTGSDPYARVAPIIEKLDSVTVVLLTKAEELVNKLYGPEPMDTAEPNVADEPEPERTTPAATSDLEESATPPPPPMPPAPTLIPTPPQTLTPPPPPPAPPFVVPQPPTNR